MEKESGTTLRFAASIVVACMLVNPLTQRMLSLGQTSMIVPGAFAIGHWLIEKRWCWLGPAVISFAAVKPHLALPLLAIMPLLYGWRETIRCAGFVVLFAILGCLVTTGSFHTIFDFLHYASTGPLSIGFNQVTYDQIISWNRILYVLSGIAINLSALQILIGYLIVAGLVWTRVQVIQQRRPSRSLLIASAAMASLFCSQPKGYDLVIVVLTAPYLVRLWREGDRFTPGIILILFEVAAVPRALPAACVRHLHLANASSEMLLSYRAFATALLLLTILLRGGNSADIRFPMGRVDVRSLEKRVESLSSHRSIMDALTAQLESVILKLLGRRAVDATICPSEAARAVAPENWKPLMKSAREAARQLVAKGEVDALQGGVPVDLDTCRGPIRLRLARKLR